MKNGSLFLFLGLCLWFIGPMAQAQEVITIGQFFAKKAGGKVILRGTVKDPETGDLIEGASVTVPGKEIGTRTNSKGEYILLISIGKHEIQVRYLGRAPIRQKIEIFDDGVLNFGLTAQAYSLREVVIESVVDEQNVRTTNAGITQIQVKEIRALPTFLGEVDVVKSLLLLPGVSTVGEGASGFNVRGGRIDQNLVQFNGATLFNPSHLLGFFSAFNSDVVDQFTLYKGSVPAQYGGRASSVLDIFAKSGSFTDYSFKGGLGLISSRFAAEGPIVKDKTSFLVGGRISYSDWMLQLIKQPEIQQSSANFYDGNAIISHRLGLNHTLNLSYYGSNDFFQYAEDFGFEYGTQNITLQYKGILSERLTTTSFAGWGDYRSRSFVPGGIEGFSLGNGIRYYQFKQDFFFVPEKHSIHAGLEGNLHEMKPDILVPQGENSVVFSETVEKDRSRDIALYVNDEWEIADNFSISLGLRYSFYQQIGEEEFFDYEPGQIRRDFTIIDTTYFAKGEVVKSYGGLEPRVSLRLGVGKNASIKASYNRIRQYIHLVSNSTAPTPVDIWQVSTPYIPPQIADNYSLGFYQNFRQNVWETFVEVYYRNQQNLLDYKDFPDLLLNPHLETDLVSGLGRAYGGELYIRRKAGRWTGWLSYSYTRSQIKIDPEDVEVPVNQGEWFPTNYDQPHNLTLVSKWQLGKRNFFSVNFVHRTGRPITGLITNYEQNRSPIPHYSDRNAYRIPDYYRLDVSLLIAGPENPDRDFDWDVSLSVYNLLGRRNAFSVFYQKPGSVLVPRPFQLSVLGSVFPSITYNFSF